MILHNVNLLFKERLRLRGIGDCHIGARAAEEKRLKRDIDTVLNEDDSYVILMGDQCEAIVRQDLKRFQTSSVREDLLDELDSLLNAQLRETVKIFQPLADANKIIGAMMGNHELAIQKNYSFDIHREFCERLNIKNLGYSCMVRLTTIRNSGSGSKRNVIVYAHHGHGGGRKSGASINRLEDLTSDFAADIFMMGHNHRRHASVKTSLAMTTNGAPRLIERDHVFIRTGGYYKTYQDSLDPTYSEKAGYPPTKIGTPPHVDIKIYGEHNELRMEVTQ